MKLYKIYDLSIEKYRDETYETEVDAYSQFASYCRSIHLDDYIENFTMIFPDKVGLNYLEKHRVVVDWLTKLSDKEVLKLSDYRVDEFYNSDLSMELSKVPNQETSTRKIKKSRILNDGITIHDFLIRLGHRNLASYPDFSQEDKKYINGLAVAQGFYKPFIFKNSN